LPGDVADYYDSLDFLYRDVWGSDLHHGYWESGRETTGEAVRHLTRTVIRLAGVEAGDIVCDIGCGYGGTSRFLADVWGARVTGFTLSPVQAEWARLLTKAGGYESRGSMPEFRTGDWMENELETGSIDAAVSIECVSHVADKSRFFSEVARTLKPGGRCGLTAWLCRENPRAWQRRGILEPLCRAGRLAGLGTRRDYERLVSEAGLEMESFRSAGRQVSRTWRIIFLRALGKLFVDRRYRRFLFGTEGRVREFALTVPRLVVGYACGGLDYGIFSVSKP